jgi:hypothetical protein
MGVKVIFGYANPFARAFQRQSGHARFIAKKFLASSLRAGVEQIAFFPRIRKTHDISIAEV